MRLQNNIFTHGDLLAPLDSWCFTSSRSANAIIIAIITTILSYQLTALFFDFCFARKARGRTPPSDIHIQLLTDEPSPLSLAAAVFSSDFWDRLRYYPDIPIHAHIVRSSSRIRKRVLFKLALLLIAAPLFNLLCIIFTLDIQRTISFRDAHVGGFALGFKNDFSILSRKAALSVSSNCETLNVAVTENVRSVASLHICKRSRGVRELVNPDSAKPGLSISISTTETGFIALSTSVLFPGCFSHAQTCVLSKATLVLELSGYVSVDGAQFRIAPSNLDVETMKRAIALEHPGINDVCDNTTTFSDFQTFSDASERHVTVSQHFYCSALEPSAVNLQTLRPLPDIAKRVTFVDAPDFKIIGEKRIHPNKSKSSNSLTSGDDLPFLSRRTSVISPAVLCMVLALTLLLRFVTKLFVVNDVENEIEVILKRFFHIPWSDTLLRYNAGIGYGHKSYIDNELLYGLQPCDAEFGTSKTTWNSYHSSTSSPQGVSVS